jgi:hypothetical protein
LVNNTAWVGYGAIRELAYIPEVLLQGTASSNGRCTVPGMMPGL